MFYEGIRHVKKKGRAQGRISSTKLVELIGEFQNIYYFNLKNAYMPGANACRQSVTDMPSAITSVTWDGSSRTIIHYHGCRRSQTLDLLTRLEEKIDEAVNANQWIK